MQYGLIDTVRQLAVVPMSGSSGCASLGPLWVVTLLPASKGRIFLYVTKTNQKLEG